VVSITDTTIPREAVVISKYPKAEEDGKRRTAMEPDQRELRYYCEKWDLRANSGKVRVGLLG